ncbi:MAG: glycosyltransferase [Nanoarchaeota archaeon]|nr:glycosyltransferase [Nanoarchaeota archaeon]
MIQEMQRYKEALSYWPYKGKFKGKTLDEILTIDGDIPYWKFHKFRFANYLYNIPFRERNLRYKPILENRPDPFISRLKIRIVYFAINIYLTLIIIYLFFRSLFNRQHIASKKRRKKKIGYLSHESLIRLDTKGNVSEVLLFEDVRKKVNKFGKFDEAILVTSPMKKPWKKPKKGNYLYLNDYITPGLFKKSLKQGFEIADKWRKIPKKLKSDTMRENNRDLYSFVRPDIDFLFRFPIAFLNTLYYYAYKELIKKEGLDIVLTQSGIYERCALAACHKLDIPSVFFAHSILFEGGYFFDFFPKTHYFFYNENDRKSLIRYSGLKPENVHVIGPYFIDDVITRYKGKKKKEKKRSVLILAQPVHAEYGENETKRYIDSIFSKLAELKDIRIKIKLHPRDIKQELWTEAIKNSRIKNYEIISAKAAGTANENILYDAILESDIAITFSSTTCFDALILGKPVIIIELNIEKDFFTDAKSFIRIRYDQDIAKNIRKIFDDRKYRESLKGKIEQDLKFYYYKTDGKSCERAAKEIKKILTKKNED